MLVGIDFETCSAADLDVCGADVYARHETTRVHCGVLALASEKKVEEVFRWTPGKVLPRWFWKHVEAGRPLMAHNASFEISILTHVLTPQFGWPVGFTEEQWIDTIHLAAAANLPLSLGNLAKALSAPVLKDEEGAAVMRRLATVTASADGWVYPTVAASDLERLLSYCETDVLAMIECFRRLPKMTAAERKLAAVDRRINRRGATLDLKLAAAIRDMADRRGEQLVEEVWSKTGDLMSVSSAPTLLSWLHDQKVEIPKVRRKRKDGTFEFTESIDKTSIRTILKRDDVPRTVRDVLEAREEAGRLTSLAKTSRAPEMVPADLRLRWALQFCGAHTGRWSSYGFQLHNLAKAPKRFKDVSDRFTAAVLARDLDTASILWSVLEGLSFLLRRLVVPAAGKELIGADYSAVEARGVAWLAGQADVLAMFDGGVDVYTADAKKINSTDRQLGKIARLGLGYGMGAVTFYERALKDGVDVTLARAAEVQKAWREANPKIVALWATLEEMFRAAMAEPGVAFPVGDHLRVLGSKSCVRIVLPSGRALHYWHPRIVRKTRAIKVVEEGLVVEKEMTRDEIVFSRPKGGGWESEGTYGGKLTENVTQAVCRDIMGDALVRLDATRYDVILHVHDSVSAEVPAGTGSVDEFCSLMTERPSWASTFPIAVEGYRGLYFKG